MTWNNGKCYLLQSDGVGSVMEINFSIMSEEEFLFYKAYTIGCTSSVMRIASLRSFYLEACESPLPYSFYLKFLLIIRCAWEKTYFMFGKTHMHPDPVI